MSNQAVSRNYAQALFEAGRDTGRLEQIRKDAGLLRECFKSEKHLLSHLSSPGFSRSSRLSILSKALDKHITDLTRNFLFLVMQHRRHNLLLQIFDELDLIIDKEQNILKATLTSARQLDNSQKQTLRQALEKKTGCTLDMQFQVDPQLLAGFVLVYGETMFDCSTIGTLNRYRDTLKKFRYN